MSLAASDLSYLHTRPVKSYHYTTLPRTVEERARLHPDREICVMRRPDGSRSSLTNAGLYNQACQLARHLVSLGIRKGDLVALTGPNTIEMVVGYVGVICAGAVVLNISIDMKTDLSLIQDMLETTRTKCIIADCGENNALHPAVKALLGQCLVQADQTKRDVVFLRPVDMEGFQNVDTLQTILTKTFSGVDLPDIYPEDSALIFTTSGSTGKPKLALHTHFTLACYPFSWSPEVDYEITEYNDRPFSWIGGSPVFHILLRKCRVFMDAAVTLKGQNAAFLWKVMKEEQCTDALLFPYVVRDLLELPSSVSDDGYLLQHIITGGQLIDSVYTQVIDRFSNKLVVVYGSTEALGTAMRSVGRGETLIPGDVGWPYPAVEIRIVDDEDNPVTIDTVGKVQIRGPCTMKEYYDNPELTEKYFAARTWFRMGDIGKVTPTGRLFLLGRENDIITRGGRKIYPVTLEDLIKNMASVLYVVVVSVPDKRLTEEICVCFVSSDASPATADDVREFCKQHLLAEGTVDGQGHMPTYFLRYAQFPMLGNGKPDKKALRVDAAKRLDLSSEI